MWQPQLEAFSGDVPAIIAPNLPGFGGSESAGNVMTMAAAADRVAGAIRDAGISRALVCGLSMGGYVAFGLWRQYPSLVAGLVFANTKAGADDEAGRERRAGLATRLRAEGNGFLVDSPPPLLSTGAPDELWAKVKAIIAAQPADAIAAASLGMAERPDSTTDLSGITVPVLAISSSNDTLIPPADTTAIADGIPRARYEEIDGPGHLSNLEAPDAFNSLLREHYEKVVAAEG